MTLTVNNLSIDIGDRSVLSGVDLSVDAGEFVAVTGRTGAGKTTLLNAIGGLTSPADAQTTTGSIVVAGVQVVGADPATLAVVRRRHVGYVFQNLNLIPTLPVIENIALPLQLDGIHAEEAMLQARQALAEVELADRESDLPGDLSGGQRQRVAVARALVGQRSLLLADEPTAALDRVTAEATLRLLRKRAEEGAAVLLVTHDSGQAAWANRIVRLKAGAMESAPS